MESLLLPENCKITDVSHTDEGTIIAAHSTVRRAYCPACGEPSSRSHGSYARHPRDLPIGGAAVRLELQVPRFRCQNAACTRHTFSCSPAELLSAHARRTARLSKAQCQVGVALGGGAGARLLAELRMVTSADTVLRLVRRQPLVARATPRVLGVDDFAFRKRRTYGTLLVDLEQRVVVDVLAERTSEAVATWLRAHPGVEIVARGPLHGVRARHQPRCARRRSGG